MSFMRNVFTKSKISLSIVLLGLLVTISFSSITPTTAILSDGSSVGECHLTALIDSDPISILNNSAFDLYGFPGDGSVGNPYIIENLNITTPLPGVGIFVGDVNVTFIIQNCYINAYGSGIYFSSFTASYIATVTNNYIEDHTTSGISLVNALGVKITDNIIKDSNYGIYTNYADYSTFENNTCFNNNYGFYLYDTYDCDILDNFCYENEYGFYGEYVWGNHYENNIIKDGDYGFFAYSGDYMHIVNNTIDNMSGLGVILNDTHWLQMSLNSIKSSGVSGIDIRSSNNMTIYNNSITYCTFGMTFNEVESSTLTFNRFQNNNEYGIYVDAISNYNLFYYNAFLNNVGGSANPQAYDVSLNSSWYENSTKIGNYWDNYIGTGSYAIGGGLHYDLYPLGASPVVTEFNLIMNSLYLLLLILFIPVFNLVKKRQRRF